MRKGCLVFSCSRYTGMVSILHRCQKIINLFITYQAFQPNTSLNMCLEFQLIFEEPNPLIRWGGMGSTHFGDVELKNFGSTTLSRGIVAGYFSSSFINNIN